MTDELENSNKVRLDGLGMFYIGLKTSGAVSDKEFTVTSIKGSRVNFYPHRKHTGTSKGYKYQNVFTEGPNAKEWDYNKGEAEDEPAEEGAGA